MIVTLRGDRRGQFERLLGLRIGGDELGRLTTAGGSTATAGVAHRVERDALSAGRRGAERIRVGEQ